MPQHDSSFLITRSLILSLSKDEAFSACLARSHRHRGPKWMRSAAIAQ